MPYFYLIFCVIAISVSSVCAEFFNRRFTDGRDRTPFYILITACVALLGWAILWAFDSGFERGVLAYSLVFSVGYMLSMTFFTLAVRTGPVSLTSLFLQISNTSAAVWGFFFWEDTEATVFAVVGLVLVVVSLALCLLGKRTDGEKKITPRWILFVALMFLGNGSCTIIQKEEQLRFHGSYGSMMMFFAMLFVFGMSLIVFFCSPKQGTRETMKRAGWLPAVGATCNVVLNLFVIRLAKTSLSPSVIYPVLAVGGLALTTLISVICFRERLSRVQWAGLGLGAVAVALLNLG